MQDDKRLLNIIYQKKSGNKMPCWNDVADLLDGDRTSKSCRLRYVLILILLSQDSSPFEPFEITHTIYR